MKEKLVKMVSNCAVWAFALAAVWFVTPAMGADPVQYFDWSDTDQ